MNIRYWYIVNIHSFFKKKKHSFLKTKTTTKTKQIQKKNEKDTKKQCFLSYYRFSGECNMIRFYVILTCLLAFHKVMNCHQYEDKKKLLEYLFDRSRYDKSIRPVKNSSTVTKVSYFYCFISSKDYARKHLFFYFISLFFLYFFLICNVSRSSTPNCVDMDILVCPLSYFRLLKWYYVQFSLKKFGCNCYLFQKIIIYNNERHTNDNVSC